MEIRAGHARRLGLIAFAIERNEKTALQWLKRETKTIDNKLPCRELLPWQGHCRIRRIAADQTDITIGKIN